jgi:PAS domain S-box-containing protein
MDVTSPLTHALGNAGPDAQTALVASGHAFAVTDARQPDDPLIWVNPAFEQLTGYRAVDVIGHNCRFLQGPDTDPAAVAAIREALAAGRTVTETMLNYRADGSTWWNEVTITPVFDQVGELTHFVGVQSDVGERVRATEEMARVTAAEQDAALALQRSLLPVLPQVEGLELAARYVPGSDRAEVGGDWYDVLPLPDGSTGIAVGDVMGHDIQAAAAMGQLRSVLRSYAWEGHGPGEVLDRLNQLVCGLGMARIATCVYARIERVEPDGRVDLRWANAGHPPPMLKTPDGYVHLLDAGASALIGVTIGNAALLERASAQRELPVGSTLLIYSDGLIESRHRDIDAGIAALRDSFATADRSLSAEDLVDQLLRASGSSDRSDDQCLLVVRIR